VDYRLKLVPNYDFWVAVELLNQIAKAAKRQAITSSVALFNDEW
jgi:hypothetical protein